jgi:hypothetical protein
MGAFATQIITGAQDNDNSDSHPESPQESEMLPLPTEQVAAEDNSGTSDVLLHPPSWWIRGVPRLLPTDVPEDVESVVAINFRAGVDLDR